MTPEERAREILPDKGGELTKEDVAWIREQLAAAIRAAVSEALAVGGVPGVQLSEADVAAIRERAEAYNRAPVAYDAGAINEAACVEAYATSANDVPDLLADRAHLMAILRDVALDGTLEACRTAAAREREACLDEVQSIIDTIAGQLISGEHPPRSEAYQRREICVNVLGQVADKIRARSKP